MLDKFPNLWYNEYVIKRRKTLKNQKGIKPMTKKTALEIALATVKDPEARETIEAMIAQLSQKREISPEAKAKASEARKAATAEARKALVEKVAPVLRKYLTADITAKALYEIAKGELPADFSAAKVQNVLLRELAPELVKTEAKGQANTYRLK